MGPPNVQPLNKRIWTFSQMVFTAIVFYRLDGGGWDRCNIHGCNSIRSLYLPILTWDSFITFPFCYKLPLDHCWTIITFHWFFNYSIPFFDVVNIKLNICTNCKTLKSTKWYVESDISMNLEYWGKLFTAELCSRYFDNTMMKEHHFFLLQHLKI